VENFIIKTNTVQGEMALSKVIKSGNLQRKGIKPKVMNTKQYAVKFEFTTQKLKKIITKKDINLFIPLMMKSLKAVNLVDYEIEVN